MKLPSYKFLKLPMIVGLLVGMFPIDLVFKKNSRLQRFYAVYFRFLITYYALFLMTMYGKCIELLGEEELKLDEINRNICTALINTMTLVRVYVIQNQPGFKKILRYIIDTEKYLFSTKGTEIFKIYDACTRLNKNTILRYMVLVYAIIILYLIRPFFIWDYHTINGNQTVALRTFATPVWFPFDAQAHFTIVSTVIDIIALIGGSIVCYADIFLFSLLIYPNGQLKILHYILKNLDTYRQKIALQFKEQTEDKISAITFRCCIEKHREMIEYVDIVNRSIRTLMIFDFMQGSIQLASIVALLLGLQGQISVFDTLCGSAYFAYFGNRLFTYYYYSNEVTLLSESLCTSIWKSEWYNEPSNVKFMMRMFMMRTMTPLRFQIGPFGYMSLDAFIAILKASYSYITLMRSVNE